MSQSTGNNSFVPLDHSFMGQWLLLTDFCCSAFDAICGNRRQVNQLNDLDIFKPLVLTSLKSTLRNDVDVTVYVGGSLLMRDVPIIHSSEQSITS